MSSYDEIGKLTLAYAELVKARLTELRDRAGQAGAEEASGKLAMLVRFQGAIIDGLLDVGGMLPVGPPPKPPPEPLTFNHVRRAVGLRNPGE